MLVKSIFSFSHKCHDYLTENVASRVYEGFSNIWPNDIVFDRTWPIFKLVRHLIKENIQTKFHDYQTENVASRV